MKCGQPTLICGNRRQIVFSVLWKVPALGDLRLGLHVRLPENCKLRAESTKAIEENAYIERWNVICPKGLRAQEISIDGLRATVTDALARIEFQDGSVETTLLKPENPSFIVKGVQTGWEVAQTYFRLGVDHILSASIICCSYLR